MVNITKTFLAKLNKDPIKVLDGLTEDEIARIIQKANYEYRNNKTTIMSDDMFDLVRDYLEIKNPKHPILNAIGASVVGEKVELPYFMGSLDKIKGDDKQLEKFRSTYTCSYIISDKLDGNSAMYYIDKEGIAKLFTRGDGTFGQDISHLIPFVKHLPKITSKGHAIRGELIISRKDFQTLSSKGANARNMVAGILNAKVPDLEIAKHIQFIAYELVNPKEAPETQFNTMRALGFKVVHGILTSDHNLSNTFLSDFLVDRRKNSEFEVDGIVVMHNALHNRTKENPKHAFAFKSVQTMEKAEVVVTGIEWNLSKDGYMIPVVVFNPVHLAGVMIQKANGFNGKYINDNKLGPGSRIIIMRSGDVIPYIVEVLTPAANGKPSMPEIDYEWSKTGVDIIAAKGQSSVDDTLKLKNIVYFFDKIDIKGISGGTITKIYNAGFKEIKSIINISKEQLMKIDGFQAKSAEKVYNALKQGVSSVDCVLLMDASNTLGRGLGPKKLETIVTAFPTILSKRYIPKKEELIKIKGVEAKTAELFIQNLPTFFKFYEECGIKCDSKSGEEFESRVESDRLKGVVVVFTGFRNKELEEYIVKNGGTVSGAINKKTTILVVKNKDGKESGKIQKVKETEEKHNVQIKILTVEEFKKQINF